MDEIDVKILKCLKANARENASVISEKVSMSVSAVIERIRKLENSGLIVRHTTIIDGSKVKQPPVILSGIEAFARRNRHRRSVPHFFQRVKTVGRDRLFKKHRVELLQLPGNLHRCGDVETPMPFRDSFPSAVFFVAETELTHVVLPVEISIDSIIPLLDLDFYTDLFSGSLNRQFLINERFCKEKK